jgi:heparin/heparan-sulfate lyase
MRHALLLPALLLSAAAPAAMAAIAPDLPWEKHEGVSIPIPPPEHPRLFLRTRDLADLQRRTTHPVLQPIWEHLASQGAKSEQGRIEFDAVRFLLSRDAGLGQRTVAAALELMTNTNFPRSGPGTRPTGRAMVTGAMVYDWCHPLLTAGQKQAYLEQFLRLARNLEFGYPPPKGDAVTGHNSEWMLMRDLLSAGIALYDEFPEMYRIAASRFFSFHAPVRNWWYRGHAFHQGSAYAETRCSSELYPLWIFDRMGAGPVYDPALQYVPYSWIYLRRPDGQLLRGGDGQSKPPKLRSLLNASYYKDPYVLADYLRTPGIEAGSEIFEFLWRDPDLTPRPVAELPLSRYMGTPYGWMIARTGWDQESVIAEMKVNSYNFGNHQHLDAGAFQIYHRGPLAIDSGIYSGVTGAYESEHHLNYSKRTIAHNCLLVCDPAETFLNRTRPIHNDGGQKLVNAGREPKSLEDVLANYRTAEVLGQGFGPDQQRPAFTYLKGDLAKAYSGKVRAAERSFVFLNLGQQPVRAALVVFDRVVASDPTFRKYWLLHAMEQPQIEGSTITIAPVQRGWRGKLVNQVLLPAKAEIASVGGPGREFWVFGKNFPNQVKAGDTESEIGDWRVEVSPREASAADRFLNVMQAMDRDVAPLAVKRIEGEGVVGIQLAGITVLFRNEGVRTDSPVTFRSAGSRFLVTDLTPGAWQVWRDGSLVSSAVSVAAEQGTLWFEGPSGTYELRR